MRWSFGTREDHLARGFGTGCRNVSAGIAGGRRAAVFAAPKASGDPAQKIWDAELELLSSRFLFWGSWHRRDIDCYCRWALSAVFAAGSAGQARANRNRRQSDREQ